MGKYAESIIGSQQDDIKNALLKDLINASWFRNIAEIGVRSGGSCLPVLRGCPNIRQYFLIDPFAEFPLGKDFYEELMDKPVSMLKMASMEAVRFMADKSLDLVFIDGDHNYESVRNDILNWLPKVRHMGIICGHDYDRREDVARAVNEILPDAKIHTQETMWVKRINCYG